MRQSPHLNGGKKSELVSFLTLFSLLPGDFGTNGKVVWGRYGASAGRKRQRAGGWHRLAATAWSEALNNAGFFQQVCLLIKAAPRSLCKMKAPHLKAYNLPTGRRTEAKIQTSPPTTALGYRLARHGAKPLLSTPATQSRPAFLALPRREDLCTRSCRRSGGGDICQPHCRALLRRKHHGRGRENHHRTRPGTPRRPSHRAS